MIDEEGNEIDDDLWTDMMEAYAQGFVSGGGGASGPSEELCVCWCRGKGIFCITHSLN